MSNCRYGLDDEPQPVRESRHHCERGTCRWREIRGARNKCITSAGEFNSEIRKDGNAIHGRDCSISQQLSAGGAACN